LGSAIVLIGIAVANIGDIVNVYRRKNENI
jgi:hypothetical protein